MIINLETGLTISPRFKPPNRRLELIENRPVLSQVGSSVEQGFPILIDGTRASEHKSERLLRMSIKEAHLPRDIANANPVHETQDRAIELSEQTGNRPSASLTRIFA